MAKNAPNDNASRIEQDALNYIKNYDWPGNIRELENFIKRLITLYPNEIISLDIIKNEFSFLDQKMVFQLSILVLIGLVKSAS